MIAGGLVVLFLLATAVRLVRGLFPRPSSPAAPRGASSLVLGWTASPLLHAALGVLAAATALRGPSDAESPDRPASRSMATPLATLSPDPEPRLSGERMPDPVRFNRPPAFQPQSAPDDSPDHEAKLERTPRELPARPLPEPPRGLAEERFHLLGGNPGPAGFPAGSGGPTGARRTALRPGLPLLATLRRGQAERLRGLPASSCGRSRPPSAAGLFARGAWARPVVWSAPRPGLARTMPGPLLAPGARGFFARMSVIGVRPGSGGPPHSPPATRPFVMSAAPRPEASGTRPNPCALNGTDLHRASSELNGTTVRVLPGGLSGTDLKGRR